MCDGWVYLYAIGCWDAYFVIFVKLFYLLLIFLKTLSEILSTVFSSLIGPIFFKKAIKGTFCWKGFMNMFQGSYAAFWRCFMLQSVLRGSENGYWITDLTLNSPTANYLPRETVPLRFVCVGHEDSCMLLLIEEIPCTEPQLLASFNTMIVPFTHLKKLKKGLVAWCHSFCLFCYNFVHTFIQSHSHNM
jgi:hypothetical protein